MRRLHNSFAWALALGLLGSCGDDPQRAPAPGRVVFDGGHAAMDGSSAPRAARGDAAVLPPADANIVLPLWGPAETHTLQVTAKPRALDLVFSVDTTRSFAGEIDALQRDLDRVVRRLRREVPDASFAVARFGDFPFTPFGEPEDRPFVLLTAVTSDHSRIASAVAQLDAPLLFGGDRPEAGAEALWQIGTGEGLRVDGRTLIDPYDGPPLVGGGRTGGVGFREGTLRVILHATDAPTHEPPSYGDVVAGTHSVDDAVGALRALGVRVIGIKSDAASYLNAVALATGAVAEPTAEGCATGIDGSHVPAREGRCPLVFQVDPEGAGLSDALITAVLDLLHEVAFAEVYASAPDDALSFVQEVRAARATPAPPDPAPARADLRPAGDGVLDTFVDVRPETRLSFDFVLRNETIAPADYDQVLRLTLRVIGDGVVLGEQTLRITVPRKPPDTLDAGADASADAPF